MKKTQNTRGYKRYFAIDTHREYHLVGAQNEDQEWVVTPRRVSIEKFPEWAKLNFREGDIVVLETTTNVWETYDIVAPLASRVLVANAASVGEIVGARVKTDKEDIKRLLKLLFGGIVPEVWVPPAHVRELRAFISYRNRDNGPQSFAKSAAQTQPVAAGRGHSQPGMVGCAEFDQRAREDADSSGIVAAERDRKE